MKRINIYRNIALVLVSVVLLSFITKPETTKYKCLIQMTNYSGEGAYIAISLLDDKGDYVKTLYVHGDDDDWYYDITEWWNFYGKKRTEIDAITGATISGGKRSITVIELENDKIDAGYKIRFETAVEDKEYYKDDVQFELTSETIKSKVEGKGFIRYIRMIPPEIIHCMIISIWRYSHLSLAISSSLFILIASITGIILAFEPISEQLQPYAVQNLENHTLAKTITILKKEYDEVLSIEKDHNNFIIASVITKEGTDERFYINPTTGKKIADLIDKAPIYKFATNLHRSLFLKTSGRIIICIVSFFLFLIAVTGIILILKRQGGILKFFSKVVKESFNQYYHVIIGRLSLVPIIIITITGVYLSLEKFSLIPSEEINHTISSQQISEVNQKSSKDFPIFKNTFLSDLKKIEFPFSDDREDYFYLKLKTKELVVDQYSGNILSEIAYPLTTLISSFSLNLHTGRGNILWSIILLLSTVSILFFIYSGFSMTLNRKKKTIAIPKNIHHSNEAEYIILVGSETGNTYHLAKQLFDALANLKKKVFIAELNSYQHYKKIKHLLVLTSTYGKGEAPTNGAQFLQKIDTIIQADNVQFSVVGFGSHAYPDFCQYAIEIDNTLSKNSGFTQTIPLEKIHNQSYEKFQNWLETWSNHIGLPMHIEAPVEKPLNKSQQFKVIERTSLQEDQTFLLRLKPTQKVRCQSGDLLAFYPNNETVPRYYSIGSIKRDLLLCIKKHDLGVCSTFLSQLEKGDLTSASIKKNNEFHFPKNRKQVVLISNGTGIGPFLGMINENKKNIETHLFWGGRTKSSFDLYRDHINNSIKSNQLTTIHTAFSREKENKKYVQYLVLEESILIAKVLSNNGIIMICGSLAMEEGVKNALATIAKVQLNAPLEKFNNQIKTDCY